MKIPAANRLRRAVFLTLALALSASVPAKSAPLPEYAVKAAFLLNVAKYATWPPPAFSDPSAPIVIGILGEDPFGPVLDRLVSGRIINNRRIVVRRSRRMADFRGAHVVFIAASESDRAASICASLAESGSLCVGDTTATATATAINFSVESGRIVFSVNLAAARRSNVAISSKLLQLAKSVTGTSAGQKVRL